LLSKFASSNLVTFFVGKVQCEKQAEACFLELYGGTGTITSFVTGETFFYNIDMLVVKQTLHL